MNERIKELAEEAGFPKFDEMYDATCEKLIKFAELIENGGWQEFCEYSLELDDENY